MRLLQRQDDGSITLTEDLIDHVPPYAILSHTWGNDDDEVVFKDLVGSAGRQKDGYQQKPGYRKIDYCAKWAAADRLQYFWIDSCCINKSNSTELQEAITSMFRWYQDAAKCYVYLSDVISNEEQHQRTLPQPAWESAFRQSRWFTRGWTLQELLAPRCVEFFSEGGHKLGSRPEFSQLLQEVTGISIDALCGKSLSKFSVNERMLWSRGRETKHKEDKAYSLLGIFDVSMYVNYGEGEERAMGRLRRKIKKKYGSQRTQDSHFMVPFGRNDHFVGRDAILEQLLNKIPPNANKDDCQRTVVEGLGGIGKTQIALEAAYRIRDIYPDCSVFWVPAIDLTSFENAYREIGQRLELRGISDEGADIKTLVKAGLSRKDAGSWLLIVDNADDLELLGPVLADCLPFKRKGSILFTTRSHKITALLDVSHEDIIPLPKMDSAEASKLLQIGLRKRQKGDRKSTKRLLNFLANLPLAIKQASAFLTSNTNVTVSGYLDSCESSDADSIELLSEQFQDRHRYTNNAKKQNPIATTWLISFEHISQHDPQAADYLKFMCFLAEKDIPLSLLPVAPKIKMAKAVGTLKAYAFITERDTPDTFDIHPLIRLVMRNWLQKSGEWMEWRKIVFQQLGTTYPFPEHENKQIWIKYLPHGQALLDARGTSIKIEDTRLLSKVAVSCDLLGKYGEAERLHRRVLRPQKEVLGKRHPGTLCSMGNLATTLRHLGKYKEAEKMHRRVLRLQKKVLGKRHPNTLSSIHGLATALGYLGKYEEAEKMHRQVLRLQKKVLGKRHPITLSGMGNLSITLRYLGKYEEAEKMHRRVLRLRKKLLGRRHPDTLGSMYGLAITLRIQQNYKKAEKKFRQVLKLRKEVLGRQHSSTLHSMTSLAITLKNQQNHKKAEKIFWQVLKLQRKVLGRQHPDTLGSMHNLAITLGNRQNHKKAEKKIRQVLKLQRKVLGRQHPKTLHSVNSLALCLGNQHNHKKAENKFRQVIKLQRKVLGRQHPDTLNSMHNLAITLGNQQNHKKAEKKFRQVLKLREKVLGRQQPSTFYSMNGLATALRSQGKYKEAEETIALQSV